MLTRERPLTGLPRPPTRRARILVAPVTVTPTQPLTPSYLKGLLWTDVLVRATAAVADVTRLGGHTTYLPCGRTVEFWEFLDRTAGDVDFSACSDVDIGEYYVRYRKGGVAPSAEACRPYLDAVEADGWVHPASARILELRRKQYERLGLTDPGRTRPEPPGLSIEQLTARLKENDLCIDLRPYGGPVCLDATRYGMPLRRIVAADGRPDHLACSLRHLVPLAGAYDETVLLCDSEREPDHIVLQKVLEHLGATVRRVTPGRVPVDGTVASAGQGGWQPYTVAELLGSTDGYRDDVLRLGMRLYFIATLGPGTGTPFSVDLLHRSLHRAGQLLASSASDPDAELATLVDRYRGHHGYVDPYRLTTGLLARHNGRPVRELIEGVFACTS